MSRNTPRGHGKSGGQADGRKGARGDDASTPAISGQQGAALQPRPVEELSPAELKQRIKEELRKIRELDALEPGAAATETWTESNDTDRLVGAPTSVGVAKEQSLSSTIMGLPVPASLSSRNIVVTAAAAAAAAAVGMPAPARGPGAAGVREPAPGPDRPGPSRVPAETDAAPDGGFPEGMVRKNLEDVSVEPDRARAVTRGTSFGRDLHLAPGPLGGPSNGSGGEVITPEEVLPRADSSRALALRAAGPVPEHTDWEPTDVSPVRAPEAWSVPGEHDSGQHLPWYDQPPEHEDVYEEEPGRRVHHALRRAVGVGLGVTLALGTFYVIRMNGGIGLTRDSTGSGPPAEAPVHLSPLFPPSLPSPATPPPGSSVTVAPTAMPPPQGAGEAEDEVAAGARTASPPRTGPAAALQRQRPAAAASSGAGATRPGRVAGSSPAPSPQPDHRGTGAVAIARGARRPSTGGPPPSVVGSALGGRGSSAGASRGAPPDIAARRRTPASGGGDTAVPSPTSGATTQTPTTARPPWPTPPSNSAGPAPSGQLEAPPPIHATPGKAKPIYDPDSTLPLNVD
jgi:hypothetical protein